MRCAVRCCVMYSCPSTQRTAHITHSTRHTEHIAQHTAQHSTTAHIAQHPAAHVTRHTALHRGGRVSCTSCECLGSFLGAPARVPLGACLLWYAQESVQPLGIRTTLSGRCAVMIVLCDYACWCLWKRNKTVSRRQMSEWLRGKQCQSV
jgi:hypothetical protein